VKSILWVPFCAPSHKCIYPDPIFTSPLVSFGSPYAIECSYGNNHIAEIKPFSHSLPLCLLCLFSECEWKPLMCSNFSPCFVRCSIYSGMLVFSFSHQKHADYGILLLFYCHKKSFLSYTFLKGNRTGGISTFQCLSKFVCNIHLCTHVAEVSLDENTFRTHAITSLLFIASFLEDVGSIPVRDVILCGFIFWGLSISDVIEVKFLSSL